MKRTISICLLAALACALLAGCGAQDAATNAGGEAQVTRIRFSDSMELSAIEALAGKSVEIVGYMATISPVSGKFLYLLNLPYQSCPFCVPNSTQLANTIAVYAKEGSTFGYTDQAVLVKGRMEVGDYVDEYGYIYNYRIVDATYEVFDLAGVSSDYALWYSIAEDGIVAEINGMFDYLFFVCQWTEYQSDYEDEAGNRVVYYLYPGDAENYLADTGPYGYASYCAEDYFPGLIARARAIGGEQLADLEEILVQARTLSEYARAELAGGKYAYDQEADKYTLTQSAYMADEFSQIYQLFAQWLGKWAL